MLVIDCHDHLEAVRAFARSVGAEAQLQDRLDYLASYGARDAEDEAVRCRLRKDFAPHSFTFVMERQLAYGGYKPWFVGGLIYSGPDAPPSGVSSALSVSLSATPRDHSW